MSIHSTLLVSRSVLRLTGRDARAWLQGLVTNDVESLHTGEGRFAALLSPQGKILFDFFVVADGDGLLLDCRQEQVVALEKRLTMYRLRADVAIAPAGSSLAVAAAWGDGPPPVSRAIIYLDPRDARMGWRLIAEPQELDLMGVEAGGEEAYAAHRVACGVPEGGADFLYGDAFPHEANMDLLNGVDFKKGCYVGQEVVSRVRHRGTARKRILRLAFAPARELASGAAVMAGEVAIGEVRTVGAGVALAAVRTDRLAETAASGATLSAGGVEVTPLDMAGAGEGRGQ